MPLVPILLVVAAVLGLVLALGLVWRWVRRRRQLARRRAAQAPPPFRPALQLDIDESEVFAPGTPPSEAQPYYLVLDTETLEAIDDEEPSRPLKPSRLVALSWQLVDRGGRVLKEESHILHQTGAMDSKAIGIHGITNEMLEHGEDPLAILPRFLEDLSKSELIVAHNAPFHLEMLAAELEDKHISPRKILYGKSYICTMEWGRDLGCKIGHDGRRLYPRLDELFGFLYFGLLGVPITYRSKTLRDVRLVSACLRRMSR